MAPEYRCIPTTIAAALVLLGSAAVFAQTVDYDNGGSLPDLSSARSGHSCADEYKSADIVSLRNKGYDCRCPCETCAVVCSPPVPPSTPANTYTPVKKTVTHKKTSSQTGNNTGTVIGTGIQTIGDSIAEGLKEAARQKELERQRLLELQRQEELRKQREFQESKARLNSAVRDEGDADLSVDDGDTADLSEDATAQVKAPAGGRAVDRRGKTAPQTGKRNAVPERRPVPGSRDIMPTLTEMASGDTSNNGETK